MEAKKIKGQALSIVLPNGQEVTYCERGAENKEVLITGAFYFHTVMPVVEALGKKYHVYGIVMRISGDSEFRMLLKAHLRSLHGENGSAQFINGMKKGISIRMHIRLRLCREPNRELFSPDRAGSVPRRYGPTLSRNRYIFPVLTVPILVHHLSRL